MPTPVYSVCKDIVDLLHTNSLGTFGTDLYIGKEPAEVQSCVTIYQYGGHDPDPKFRLNYPSIQIRVKGDVNGYSVAEQKMQSIVNVLLGMAKQTINSNVYVGVWQIADTMFLKYDENEHPIFVSNWRIAVQPSISDNRIALG